MPPVSGWEVDLPFMRVRYLRVDENLSREVSADKLEYANTQQADYSAEGSAAKASGQRIGLGHDPLVSKASVIHELVYNRASVQDSSPKKNNCSYSDFAEKQDRIIDLCV